MKRSAHSLGLLPSAVFCTFFNNRLILAALRNYSNTWTFIWVHFYCITRENAISQTKNSKYQLQNRAEVKATFEKCTSRGATEPLDWLEDICKICHNRNMFKALLRNTTKQRVPVEKMYTCRRNQIPWCLSKYSRVSCIIESIHLTLYIAERPYTRQNNYYSRFISKRKWTQ